MKPLVICTKDLDLLAVVAEVVDATVIRAYEPEHAADLAVELRGGGVAAYGADVTATFRGYPPAIAGVVVHTGKQRIDWQGVMALGAEAVLELPAELDWLHDRLGVYRCARA